MAVWHAGFSSVATVNPFGKIVLRNVGSKLVEVAKLRRIYYEMLENTAIKVALTYKLTRPVLFKIGFVRLESKNLEAILLRKKKKKNRYKRF